MVTQADIDNNGNPNPDGYIHNAATGDSDETEPQDSFTDTPIEVPDVVGQITPTATTCQQFSTDTAADLEVLKYSLKGNPAKISQVSPGVLFYWVEVSGGGTYTITQTLSANTMTTKFSLASGSFVWNANCAKVRSAS